MECNNCFGSKDWNLINEYLFDENHFSNIKLKKQIKWTEWIEYIVYQSNCNDCKKFIWVTENYEILKHTNSERKKELDKIFNKYSTENIRARLDEEFIQANNEWLEIQGILEDIRNELGSLPDKEVYNEVRENLEQNLKKFSKKRLETIDKITEISRQMDKKYINYT